ncbi:hypothetical protein T440DRAFT_469668 [Plenodomus tracheiphilus IPT5]|uniref:Uncharacterized protein n=1 Tax=Plenodomus tracheiphilus IPT5 TaxID=1408161 RepID=A0A6A7B055_9PLEO|nr:hypothetical protein T440DRAFT_469668 [Plenodomus tracheiphilus IPT5]
MQAPRSTSRSRRSYPNLHNLSLAPLSAQYPLDASAPPSPDDEHSSRTPRTSYIAQKSAPTTPGILSLSQSRSNSRHRATKAYAYDSYFIDTSNREIGDVPKAKSTSTLLHHTHAVSFADQTPLQPIGSHGGGDASLSTGKLKQGRHHTRKRTAPLPTRTPLSRHHTSESKEEWLHRAGLAIANESRDTKGQGWLIRRESSTSLVGQTDDYESHASHDPHRITLLSGEHLPEADYPSSFFSPRLSRPGSRIPSRVASRAPSARQSRRGSRVGSRVDLLMTTGVVPMSSSTRHTLDFPDDVDTQQYDDDTRFNEPDFFGAVEPEEGESDGDEEEVKRLAREPGFGVGGWMDRLIGWTLFSVEEGGEGAASSSSSDDEDDEEEQQVTAPRLANLTRDELKLRREVEAKRRKLEREAVVAAAAVKARGGDDADSGSRPGTGDAQRSDEEVGGWQDAAWLLSVASKALLS